MATADTPFPNAVSTVDKAPSSLWRDTLRHLLEQRSAVVGLFMLSVLIFVAVFAPVLATHDPTEDVIGIEVGAKKRSAPCIHLLGCPQDQPQHYFGLDGNLRDLFSRVLYGARISLTSGMLAVSFSIVIGTLIGLFSGYAGGWFDNIVMRVMDVLLAFPSLVLAIAIVSVLGPGIVNALLAIGIVSVPSYARIMRASVLSIKEQDFVTADRALGVSRLRIVFRRILPNALTPIIVTATLGIATAIVEIAGLSFLGLGAQLPTPEWGSMISLERNQVFSAPHLIIFPGIALVWTVLSFNLIGDGLRDALDPRLNR
jgi:peptide/nickel transport system permease protein